MNFVAEFAANAMHLIVNLTLLGASVAAGIALAFRLTRVASPRARYWIAVAAFAVAAAAPLAATFYATPETERFLPTDAKSVSTINHTHHIAEAKTSTPPIRTFISPLSVPVTQKIKAVVRLAAESPLAICFLTAWIGVAFLLLAREAVGHFMLARARRAWQAVPAAKRQELAWPERVPLYLDEQTGPSAVGWLRPAVVLPSRLFTDLPTEAAQRIARHELAHAQWRDPLVNALLRIARAALWPSLPLWFLVHIIHAEREAAADRAAIDSAPSSAEASRMAADYAASLVLLAQWPKRGAYQLTGTQLGGVPGLEDRVRRLLQASAQLTLARLILGSATLLAGVIGMAFLPVMPLTPMLTALAQRTADQASVRPMGGERNLSDAASEVAEVTVSSPGSGPSESSKQEAAATTMSAASDDSERSRESETTPPSEKAEQNAESDQRTPQAAQGRLVEKLEQSPDIALQILNLDDAPLIIRHATMKNLTREEGDQYWQHRSGDLDSARSPDTPDQSATMPRATVFNKSKRRITGMAFGFKKKDGSPWSPGIGETKLVLEPGASFNYRAKWTGTNIGIPCPADEITIFVLGVEYEDGSTWGNYPFSKQKEK